MRDGCPRRLTYHGAGWLQITGVLVEYWGCGMASAHWSWTIGLLPDAVRFRYNDSEKLARSNLSRGTVMNLALITPWWGYAFEAVVFASPVVAIICGVGFYYAVIKNRYGDK